MSEDIKHTPEGAEDFKSQESTEENNVKGTDATDVYDLEEHEKNLNESEKNLEITREELERIKGIGGIFQDVEGAEDYLRAFEIATESFAHYTANETKKFWVDGDDTDLSGDRPNTVQTKPLSEIVMSFEGFSEEEKVRFSEALKLSRELADKLRGVKRDFLKKIPSEFLVEKGDRWYKSLTFKDDKDSPIAKERDNLSKEQDEVRGQLYNARWQEVQGPKSDEPKEETK